MRTIAILLLAAAAPAFADEPRGWDRPAALRHLDERGQAWLDFSGAYRGQGATRTTCLSCHSFVPYMLARSVTLDVPAAPRAKSLDQIKQRVAHWSDLDTPIWKLPYDHTAAKKRESRGTEAVLNALALATDDRARGLDKPGPETKTALDILWSTQRQDGAEAGSWDWLDFGLEPWEAGDGRYYGAPRSRPWPSGPPSPNSRTSRPTTRCWSASGTSSAPIPPIRPSLTGSPCSALPLRGLAVAPD